jgi:hypothetical protein
MKAIVNPISPPDMGKRPAWRQRKVGASNRYGNALFHESDTFRHHLAGQGDASRRKLLSKQIIDLILEEQSRGMDLAIGMLIRFAIGYDLKRDEDGDYHCMPIGDITYWYRSDSSLGIMDVGRKITITYSMNKRSPSAIANPASKVYI